MSHILTNRSRKSVVVIGIPPGRTLRRATTRLLMSMLGLAVVVLLWHLFALRNNALPSPATTFTTLAELLGEAFTNEGPNQKGIGLQVGLSLLRVFSGWLIGTLIAVPLGFVLGLSPLTRQVIDPLVQVLRPISPLAWFPIGLVLTRNSLSATLFVIVITSLWPTLLNTAQGVGSVPNEYRNVARVFRFTPRQYVLRVLLPYTLPYMLTGMRLSLGIAWLVIVAAEMLAGSVGIGYFVWDAFNRLALAEVLCAIILIGLTGLALDHLLRLAVSYLSYEESNRYV